jgi:hypothetical protein
MKTFTAKQAREQVINYKAAKVDEARKEADVLLEAIYEEIEKDSAKGVVGTTFKFSTLDELVRNFVITDLRNAGYQVRGTTNWVNTYVMWDEK